MTSRLRYPVAPLGPRSLGQRVGLYLVMLSFFGIVVGVGGAIYFEASECSAADFDGECDLAALAGFAYALIAVAVGTVLVVLWETLRALRRSAQRKRGRLQL